MWPPTGSHPKTDREIAAAAPDKHNNFLFILVNRDSSRI
jgi:hypothetical protein